VNHVSAAAFRIVQRLRPLKTAEAPSHRDRELTRQQAYDAQTDQGGGHEVARPRGSSVHDLDSPMTAPQAPPLRIATPAEEAVVARGASEIVPGDVSGGPNTSHTISVAALTALLNAVPPGGLKADYQFAVLEENVLGKATDEARRRTQRDLKRLYLLRPDSLLFRALRDLWGDDAEAHPLLAGLCALARDPVFRASSSAILAVAPGDQISSGDLAQAVSSQFPANYGGRTLATIGRNTFSSWQQTGHLAQVGRFTKIRTQAICRPASVSYALLLGHLQGARGQGLFDTLWARLLDRPKSQLVDLAVAASQRGLVEFRQAGGVIEVSFHTLLRPFDGEPA